MFFVNDASNLIGFSKADVSTICKSHIQSHAVSQQNIFNDGNYSKEDTTEEESDVMKTAKCIPELAGERTPVKDLQMIKPYSLLRYRMPNERLILPLLIECIIVLSNPLRLRCTFFSAEFFHFTLVRSTEHLTPGKHRSNISCPLLSFIVVATSVLKLLCSKFITQ